MSKPAPRCDLDLQPTPALYLAVGLEAGAVIALQISIMRIFAVGSWAHFGSLVVSLAMLGFGLTSAVMCIGKGWFDRHWRGVTAASLLLFGPLTVASNLLAQQIPFNAIFLVSDPMQKWRLAGNFLLFVPWGLLFALRFRDRSWRTMLALTLAISLGIELWQALTATGRSSDVTDIVVNTAGGFHRQVFPVFFELEGGVG